MFVLQIYPQDSGRGISWGRIPRSGLHSELRMILEGRKKKAWFIKDQDENKWPVSFLAWCKKSWSGQRTGWRTWESCSLIDVKLQSRIDGWGNRGGCTGSGGRGLSFWVKWPLALNPGLFLPAPKLDLSHQLSSLLPHLENGNSNTYITWL